ncbi:hypothetical protein L7F22_054922 [Adiantum nelumboides]|nr:hypothetical protein [Adiantum nelumboides]
MASCPSGPELLMHQQQGDSAPAADAAASEHGRYVGHALVVPLPAQGHLNPMMQLAKQLASRSFLVTFLITSRFHARIPSLLHRNIRILHIPDGMPPDCDPFAGGNIEPLCRAFEALAAPVKRLVQKLVQEIPPLTCIVSDMFAPFTQDVATDFNLPRVAVWLQSAASFMVNLHVPLLISKGHIPVCKENSGELITCIPAHPPLAPWELPSFYQVPDLSDFMVQFKLKPFELPRLKQAHCILINTFTALESQILNALNKQLSLCQEDDQHQHPPLLINAAGPFLPPAYVTATSVKHTRAARLPAQTDTTTGMALWTEDTECIDWLDQQAPKSVLYVSFGSIVSMQAAQFLELLGGLDMACSNNSELRVLWVVRPDFLKNVEAEMVGVNSTIMRGREKLEGVLYMTSWVPQAMVLAHAAVGAFLTHCGWNSTLEGVSMGVPMLGWPLFSEQWLNRKWVVEEWRIGLKFQEDEQGLVRREEVQRVIWAMMKSPLGRDIRERALRLKEASTQAWTATGSSLLNLNRVVNSLQKNQPRDFAKF